MNEHEKIEQLINRAISSNSDHESLACLKKVKKITGNDSSKVMNSNNKKLDGYDINQWKNLAIILKRKNNKLKNSATYKDGTAEQWYDMAQRHFNENKELKSSRANKLIKGKSIQHWHAMYLKQKNHTKILFSFLVITITLLLAINIL